MTPSTPSPASGSFRRPDARRLHDGLPVGYLVADLRHLPAIERPGPHLQRANAAVEEGRRVPRGAAVAARQYRASADSFWRRDGAVVDQGVAQLVDPRPSRSRGPRVAAFLGLGNQRFTTTEVAVSIAAERRSNAQSFNAFVRQLEKQAHAAYRWRAARWASASTGTLAATLVAAASLLG